ncbi:sugar kinase [Microbacterium kribbense]|uniref:Sugar kinase n=1 Tax=Microbacterium kribbense TaxID=433645 RepID=A0ABP7GWU2_9MICO
MKRPCVLVVGDANLDLVLRGDVVPRFGQAEQMLDAADLVLGSSGGIVASGLARLGVATALVARVGDDLFGARTRELVAAAGVDVSSVLSSPEPTGLSVILSAPADRAILTLDGAMAQLTDDDVQAAISVRRPTHVHVSAFFLIPKAAAALPERLAALHAAGVTTSLDTNWDPAGRWKGVRECLPQLDLLLPNAAEAMALARAAGADPRDPEDAALRLSEAGPVVVVKDGSRGGFAVAQGSVVRAPARAVQVVDTTGAGDSFTAGLLAAWVDGLPLATAVRWATVAGSLSTRGVGGTAGQPTRAELVAALAEGDRP